MWGEFIQAFFALLFVISLIGITALLLKRFDWRAGSMSFKKPENRRLAIKETLTLDGRRRLTIVQCDDKEYLLLTGPTHDTVIDSNLNKT